MNNLLWLAAGFVAANYLAKNKVIDRPPIEQERDPEAPGTPGGTVQGNRRMGYVSKDGIDPVVQNAFDFQKDHFQMLSA